MKVLPRFVSCFLVLCFTTATASAVTVTEPLGPNWFFQPAENLGPVINTSGYESSPAISSDGLTLIFTSDRLGSRNGSRDLWQSTRESLDAPWAEPTTLSSSVNTSWHDSGSSLSSDGLTLYFYRMDPNLGEISQDLHQSTRLTAMSSWGPATPLSDINSNDGDAHACISADGLKLLFQSKRIPTFGNSDLWQATRASTDAPWNTPSNMNAPFSTTYWDGHPSLSADELTLVWSSSREGRIGAVGSTDIWLSSRETVSSPWSVPRRLSTAVNTEYSDVSPDVSADGRTILFTSNRPGGYGSVDSWTSTAIPALAYTRFSEIPIGMRNYSGSGQEMGFSTFIFPATGGANPEVGVDNSERPRLRMRSIEAETTFETVDLSGLEDVEFAIDVRNSETSWEDEDYVRVTLSNGTTTRTVLELLGTSNALEDAEGIWRNYRADIPDDWTEAVLTIASYSDSSAGSEIFDFDDIAFFGTPVPEPTTFVLAAFALLGLPCCCGRRGRGRKGGGGFRSCPAHTDSISTF